MGGNLDDLPKLVPDKKKPKKKTNIAATAPSPHPLQKKKELRPLNEVVATEQKKQRLLQGSGFGGPPKEKRTAEKIAVEKETQAKNASLPASSSTPFIFSLTIRPSKPVLQSIAEQIHGLDFHCSRGSVSPRT